MRTPIALIALGLLTALAACATPPAPADGEPTPRAEAPRVDPLAAAVANPGRPAVDLEADARRKPRETLAFFQVEPGWTVFEMEAGAGYFTELLSYAVGPNGAVVMQNPPGFLEFIQEALERRFGEDRLPNVRMSYSAFDALDAPDGSVDLVTWVQGPHELYYLPENSEPLGDPVGSYAEIFRILKPGGAFVAIDHSAASGAAETTGDTLHRVDPAIVIAMAQAAGFTLEAQADFLANPEDPLTTSVFDPAIRGRTDQFALRFRKPA